MVILTFRSLKLGVLTPAKNTPKTSQERFLWRFFGSFGRQAPPKNAMEFKTPIVVFSGATTLVLTGITTLLKPFNMRVVARLTVVPLQIKLGSLLFTRRCLCCG
jgi:hypothetical protein